MSDELRLRIERHLTEATGGAASVRALDPLVGGACQDNWLVEAELSSGPLAGRRKLVLRSDALVSLTGSLDRAGELRVVEAAVAAGVRTPAARWPARDLTRAGSNAYFLDFADGEAIGRRVVGSPQLEAARARLADELGRELAKIHSITPATHPSLFERSGNLPQPSGKTPQPDLRAADPRGTDPIGPLLAFTRGMLESIPEPRPALELALRWLDEHRPAHGGEVTLVHGDFRTGNFLVTPSGLSAILDWEFARWGTPAEDLAWISVRDWRFGRLDRPVGGFARREELYRAYEQASGRRVDPAEVRWWEIVGNVRWALGSIHQGLRYLAGDRDLELIAIGRRSVEMEWEALRLIGRSR